MVKQPKQYFEALLGIYAPWTIDDIIIDEKYKVISKCNNVINEMAKTMDTITNSTPSQIELGHLTLGLQYLCEVIRETCNKSITSN